MESRRGTEKGIKIEWREGGRKGGWKGRREGGERGREGEIE